MRSPSADRARSPASRDQLFPGIERALFQQLDDLAADGLAHAGIACSPSRLFGADRLSCVGTSRSLGGVAVGAYAITIIAANLHQVREPVKRSAMPSCSSP